MTTFRRKYDGDLDFIENPIVRISIMYMVGVNRIQLLFFLPEAICFLTTSLIFSSEKNLAIEFISNTRSLSFGLKGV